MFNESHLQNPFIKATNEKNLLKPSCEKTLLKITSLSLTIPINIMIKIRCQDDITTIPFSNMSVDYLTKLLVNSRFFKMNKSVTLSSQLQKCHIQNKIVRVCSTKKFWPNIHAYPMLNFNPATVNCANAFYCSENGRFNAKYVKREQGSCSKIILSKEGGNNINLLLITKSINHRSKILKLSYSERGSPFYLCMDESRDTTSILCVNSANHDNIVGALVSNEKMIDVSLRDGKLMFSIEPSGSQKNYGESSHCLINIHFKKNVDDDYFYFGEYRENLRDNINKYFILIYNCKYGFNIISIPSVTGCIVITQCIVQILATRLIFVGFSSHDKLYVYNLESKSCIKTITILPGDTFSSYSMVNLSNNWVIYSEYSKEQGYLRVNWINCITLEVEHTTFNNLGGTRDIADIKFFSHDDDIGILIESSILNSRYACGKSVFEFSYHY